MVHLNHRTPPGSPSHLDEGQFRAGEVNNVFQAEEVEGQEPLQTIAMQVLTQERDTTTRATTTTTNLTVARSTAGAGAAHDHHHDHEDDDEEEEDDDDDYGLLTLLPNYAHIKAKADMVLQGHDTKMWWRTAVSVALGAGFLAYFYAVLAIKSDVERDGNYWCEADGLLIIITYCVAIGMTYFLVLKPYYGRPVYKKVLKPIHKAYDKAWAHRWVRIVVYLALAAGVITFLVLDTLDDSQRLQSALGLIVLLLFGFVFSKAPGKVRWRHVVWGMALQFLLGLLILRWPLGQAIFQCVADKVSAFLATTNAGSEFVFGDLAAPAPAGMNIFAFSVLPVTVYFSFFVQILYYLGVMQWVVLKLGWLLQVTVGTTACESVNAAGNIFLGQTEAPLMIKPFMPLMTKSELHAVMTGGFATIAGSVLAAYISFGVDPLHLISASVMSAPAALAFAKLFYPETKQSRTGAGDIHLAGGGEANVLHAAMVGVTNAIPIVANIAANLIAFIAAIELTNQLLNWVCTLAGAADGTCSMEIIFGWVFMPLAWVMGVAWAECDEVGQLIGLKTFINEFVAYAKLSEMMDQGILSDRSIVIATYALCGFSNLSSIGICLGGFGAMAPTRKKDLARVAMRAMIAGSCACFLTACMADQCIRSTVASTTWYTQHTRRGSSLPLTRTLVGLISTDHNTEHLPRSQLHPAGHSKHARLLHKTRGMSVGSGHLLGPAVGQTC